MINSITVDSTECISELCTLGSIFNTDKSPYNRGGHRHPYTAIYSLLFSSSKNKPLRFAEIGVAGGSSVLLWNSYFTQASFFFFDLDKNLLEHAAKMVGPNNKFIKMNIADPQSIIDGLTGCGGELDVLLDDSSHNIDDQKILLHTVLPYVKSGGMIIIEDISRDINQNEYFEIVKELMDKISFATFIVAEHKNRYSPGWNNDKILLLIKK